MTPSHPSSQLKSSSKHTRCLSKYALLSFIYHAQLTQILKFRDLMLANQSYGGKVAYVCRRSSFNAVNNTALAPQTILSPAQTWLGKLSPSETPFRDGMSATASVPTLRWITYMEMSRLQLGSRRWAASYMAC